MHTPDLSQLSPQDVIAVYRLVEELCDRGHDSTGWRDHFVRRLRDMFASQMGVSYLMKFTLDPGDIAPKTLIYIEQGSTETWQAYVRRGDLRGDPVTPYIMERFGTDFTCTRQEWIDDETWYATDYCKNVATPSDMDHCLYSQVAITRPSVVDGIGLCRRVGEPNFTPREVAMVRLIHQELARLWRKHDPLDAHLIPPRQREALEGIRRGDGRKAIAEKMAVSEHTVHTYEKALFDRAKVSTRAELQAALAKLVRPVLMP